MKATKSITETEMSQKELNSFNDQNRVCERGFTWQVKWNNYTISLKEIKIKNVINHYYPNGEINGKPVLPPKYIKYFIREIIDGKEENIPRLISMIVHYLATKDRDEETMKKSLSFLLTD